MREQRGREDAAPFDPRPSPTATSRRLALLEMSRSAVINSLTQPSGAAHYRGRWRHQKRNLRGSLCFYYTCFITCPNTQYKRNVETLSHDNKQGKDKQRKQWFMWIQEKGRLAGSPGDKTCNVHVFYFHNGEALFPRIWADYVGIRRMISFPYTHLLRILSSARMIWSAIKRTLKARQRNHVWNHWDVIQYRKVKHPSYVINRGVEIVRPM